MVVHMTHPTSTRPATEQEIEFLRQVALRSTGADASSAWLRYRNCFPMEG